MVDFLVAMAAIESPSRDPVSQKPVFAMLSAKLHELGFRCRRIPGRATGGHLLAVLGARGRKPRQLLLGHGDTVWPAGTLAEMPVRRDGGRLYGPGVYDMKAGLVQALFALEALRELGLHPEVQPVFFINSDEEIGSPESQAHIHRLARIMDRALVMEPSLGPEGRLKTARKGVGRFTIEISGRAAHAGLDPEKGVSAILELSYVVQALFALNDPEQGTTVNVGTIDGGTRPNVVAPKSSAEVDVRVQTQADAKRVEQAIHALRPTLPGTQLTIRGEFNRPPLERTGRNRQLWQRALDAAEMLGIALQEGTAGGGSDGNWCSLHTATLDGLGAVGDGAHAVDEHVVIEQMPPRAALLACLLLVQPMTSHRKAEVVSQELRE